MDPSRRTLDEIRSKFVETDQKLITLEQDLKRFGQFIEEFEKMDKLSKEIEQYYHTDWDDDVRRFHQETQSEHFETANQDSIWNATQDLYRLKIELLKKITNSL